MLQGTKEQISFTFGEKRLVISPVFITSAVRDGYCVQFKKTQIKCVAVNAH